MNTLTVFYTMAGLACVLQACTAARAQTPETKGATAVAAADFLNSIGANSAIARRGESLEKTIECARYLGLRWFRSGIEDLRDIQAFIELHRQAGVRFSWCPGSGGSDLPRLLETARVLAAEGALLAFEGPNEPNNWGITYQGEAGGGKASSWMAVAKYQRDMYEAVKADPVLKDYPVWSISEVGAQKDNVGLQFLVIPEGAETLMPAGTRYADYAVCHNYIYHPNSPGIEDNKTWNAADSSSACRVDGLYGNYGRTWARKFPGYSEEQLLNLPRVTTETGTTIGSVVTEEIHALNLMSMYLAQFKRGWSHTSVYLLRDRVDEAGNQKFGFYRPDYTRRKAAVYLHNLTTILADDDAPKELGALDYSIANQPTTVHDLLLQKSDGRFALVVWGERVRGSDEVTVDLGRTFTTVMIYDPTLGTTPVQTLNNRQRLALTLTNHPLVIEIPRK